jgi:hypothetical protein
MLKAAPVSTRKRRPVVDKEPRGDGVKPPRDLLFPDQLQGLVQLLA